MLHFKYNIDNLLLKNKKNIWKLAIIIMAISLSLNFIVFNDFRENIKSDLKSNKKDFAIVSGYSNLNYKGESRKEKLEEDYLEAFKIYKNTIENPTNDFEKAISYNLSYLENLSEGREYMVEVIDRKLTKDSFIKEKNKYDLNISEEDKQVLSKNSKLIRKEADNIGKVKDRLILLSSLDTLDYILDLEVDDEVVLLSNVSKCSTMGYLSIYFLTLLLFFTIILFLIVSIGLI